MGKQHGVTFLGFSEFERGALASYFRLAADRTPHYRQVPMLTDADVPAADFLVADADHAASVALVIATDRLASTVFIGAQPPEGCTAWMPRPIDALHVMRELDAMVTLAQAGQPLAVLPLGAPPSLRDTDAAAVAHVIAALAVAPAVAPEAVAPPPARDAPPRSQQPEVADVTEIFLPDASAILLEPSYGRIAAPVPAVARTPPSPTASPWPVSPATPAATTVTMPSATAPTPAIEPAEPAEPAAASTALLVDDSEIALRHLQTRLHGFGVRSDCAGNSGQAIDLLTRHSYDLVFLDVELGEDSALGGLELCQHIKHSAAAVNAAVVMVSAHHSELDRVRGALAGCDAYLGKPLRDEELEQLLERQGLVAGTAARRRRKRERAPPA